MSQQTLPCTSPPPPTELRRVGSFFRIGVYCSQENVPKGKPVLFGVIQVKRPKNVVFHYIHSSQILINLK